MKIGVAAALACLVVAAQPVRAAGVDVDFGAKVRIGDHANLFLSISSRYFERERPVVDDWGRHFSDPDDLAVFFFIVQNSGKSPNVIFKLRRSGLSWWEVGLRAGVPADVWFVAVEGDPGPPCRRAYRHWKKHRRDRSYRMVVPDSDCRHLVAVRMLHEYYGVPVSLAMQWRSSGRDVRILMTEEYDRRHHPEGSVHRGRGKKNRDDDSDSGRRNGGRKSRHEHRHGD